MENIIFTTQEKVEESLLENGIVVSSDLSNLRYLNGDYPNGTIVLLNDRYYLPIYTEGDREIVDITWMFDGNLNLINKTINLLLEGAE